MLSPPPSTSTTPFFFLPFQATMRNRSPECKLLRTVARPNPHAKCRKISADPAMLPNLSHPPLCMVQSGLPDPGCTLGWTGIGCSQILSDACAEISEIWVNVFCCFLCSLLSITHPSFSSLSLILWSKAAYAYDQSGSWIAVTGVMVVILWPWSTDRGHVRACSLRMFTMLRFRTQC